MHAFPSLPVSPDTIAAAPYRSIRFGIAGAQLKRRDDGAMLVASHPALAPYTRAARRTADPLGPRDAGTHLDGQARRRRRMDPHQLRAGADPGRARSARPCSTPACRSSGR